MEREIALVPATPDDASVVATLWFDAFPGKFGRVMGDAAPGFLDEWLQQDAAPFAHTWLARWDDAPVGYIQLETEEEKAKRKRTQRILPILSVARRHLGLGGVLSCVVRLAIMDSEPVPPGALHIKMLGVDAAWRGRGIGTQMLAYAEREARARNLPKLSLAVVIENTRAKRLYERFGFITGSERRSRLLHWTAGPRGYYLMVKTLECARPGRR